MTEHTTEKDRPSVPYSREVLEQVLIYHYQQKGPAPYLFSCGCGWGTRPEHLGKSYAGHIADVYEASVFPPGQGRP